MYDAESLTQISPREVQGVNVESPEAEHYLSKKLGIKGVDSARLGTILCEDVEGIEHLFDLARTDERLWMQIDGSVLYVGLRDRTNRRMVSFHESPLRMGEAEDGASELDMLAANGYEGAAYETFMGVGADPAYGPDLSDDAVEPEDEVDGE